MKKVFFLILQTITMNVFAQLAPVGSGVFHWNNLPVKTETLRQMRRFVEGTTAEFSYFEIHATTQEKGALPKPPHTQSDIEELIIIKEGTMKCIIGNKTSHLSAGSVLLIPPHQSQAFENIGDGPLTYYVFMFKAKNPMNMERSDSAGGSLLLNVDSLQWIPTAKGGGMKYFNRPTAMCSNMEMHVTGLKHKGPSHAPHTHIDTEIILVTEGEMQLTIDGKDFNGTAGDLFIVESNKPHGVSNAAEKPCKYFAFKWR